MGSAVCSSAVVISPAVNAGFACHSNAAAAAACGAAAEVPKKFGYCVLFWHWAIAVGNWPFEFHGGELPLLRASWNPKKVSLTASGPLRSGLFRSRGVA